MNKKSIIVAIIITAIILLSGCVDSAPAKTPSTFTVLKTENNVGIWDTIQVIHDNQYNMTCWTNDGFYSGGISCIPDSQLNMSK